MIKSINKLMKLTIAITTILSVSSVGANAEWRQNSTGWWNTEGDNYSTGWRLLDNKWYYFSESTGYMQTGWVQNTDGKWYYLQEDGSMATNMTINGYTLDTNGVWIDNSKKVVTTNTSTTPTIINDSNTVSSTTNVKPTVSSNSDNNSSNSSSSSDSSSSSSSSNNSWRNALTVFYYKDNKNVSDMATGKQNLGYYHLDIPSKIAETEAKYGYIIINIPDRSQITNMISHYKDYEVKEDNGVMKLVKKSTTYTSSSSNDTSGINSSGTITPTPTTTSSSVTTKE